MTGSRERALMSCALVRQTSLGVRNCNHIHWSTTSSLVRHTFPYPFILADLTEEDIPMSGPSTSTRTTTLSRGVKLEESEDYKLTIHALPPELLAVIFLISRDLDDNYLHGHEHLLRIQSVCCLWREVVLSTPTLWTNISLKGVLPRNPEAAALARFRLKQTLTRSKDASLDIVLDLRGANRRDTAAVEGSAVVEDILPHLLRSRSLTFLLGDRELDASLRSAIEKNYAL